jgi:L,D-peptidoglycan transpeptidase YkuD (ErfK/YbiS/YcfS/YnhG family)
MQIRTKPAGRRTAAGLIVAVALAGCAAAGATAHPSAAASSLTESASGSPTPTPSPPASGSSRPSPRATAPKKAAVAATRASRPPTQRPVRFTFPVPVSGGNATQVVTVAASGSYATVTAWQYSGGSWHRVIETTSARVGANGVVAAAVRMQGSNTTPEGTFTLTQAFGIGANPGALLPYHQVTTHDWWVEDNLSLYYNQMRTDTLGGFNTVWPEWYVNGSEHLITHTGTYQYAVVIDYNRWPAVHYKGAGIFLHVNGSGATAGCVSVPLATMEALLRWLNPAAHPRIAIG